MTDNVIIDSSVWIHCLRSRQGGPLVDTVNGLIRENKVAIVPTVRLELLSGARTPQEFRHLENTLRGLIYLDFTRRIWDVATRWAFETRRCRAPHPRG